MISDYLSVGDKLELQRLRLIENESFENRVYLSRLLDIVGDNKAHITMPILKGRIIPLTVGDKYVLCFYTMKGLYQCRANITDRYKMNNIYILEIEFLSELEKIQRRQFYRLECNIDMIYHAITESEKILVDKIKQNRFKNETEKNECLDKIEEYRKLWYKGIITDISGGGARFTSDNILKVNDTVQMSFALETSEGIKDCMLLVNIISSSSMLNRQGLYEHRVQFKDISKEKREEIIRFIFEEDRRKRMKEKGFK